MKIRFRLISYCRFVQKIMPASVLWHRHEWEDKVTSRYYGRYVEHKGKKKDQYYLEINQVVYSLHTVEDLVNLDHELFIDRLQRGGGAQAASTLSSKTHNYCSICTHKEGCPLMKLPYPERKRSCLFIPVVYLLPEGKLEVENIRPASTRLLSAVVIQSLHTEKMAGDILELVHPLSVYKHTFSFAQLQ
ncbi:hypothetical protein HHL16_03340 [Pseudoflavitalea sp. G-6-1-2]|uniref:hypothetical protein n=1 Tax=Pseudoflavitalea sp. G-6-1-2 TaxID=2728841 RepID=UPI00146C4B62|nr:hypothetical protein [Pseudoflavitalea sp. G-6-1-2]NML19889.1 hypothetical protein [Pseudoflavitalea sp. G-6-1-2]